LERRYGFKEFGRHLSIHRQLPAAVISRQVPVEKALYGYHVSWFI